MSIPTRVWTVIDSPWSGLLFSGLTATEPPADQVLNHPVAEEKGEYACEGKDPPKDCFCHLSDPFKRRVSL